MSVSHTFVGIDVGNERKGFHAVSVRDRVFRTAKFTRSHEVLDWCRGLKAEIIAVDCPSGWSAMGRSREAERDLAKVKISTYSTPTRVKALAHAKHFYDWVFNGETLYTTSNSAYPLFDGSSRRVPVCLETFPHAVVCALAGKVVPAKPKSSTRRQILRRCHYDDRALRNIDFVDAALCALTAERFSENRTKQFGNVLEGFIVLPS